MKDRLRKRLRYLWTWELANGVLLMPLLYCWLSLFLRLGWFSLLSLLLVCAMLFVGAAFWYLKGRALEGSDRLYRPETRRFFRATKVAFGAALPIVLALFVVRAFVQRGAAIAELMVGAGFWSLAVLEYINYYYVQLSYDNRADLAYLRRHRRFKRATMVRELDI